MLLAPALKAPPREIAERLAEALGRRLGDRLERAEVAGPGFLNLFLADSWYADAAAQVLDAGEGYGGGGSDATLGVFQHVGGALSGLGPRRHRNAREIFLQLRGDVGDLQDPWRRARLLQHLAARARVVARDRAQRRPIDHEGAVPCSVSPPLAHRRCSSPTRASCHRRSNTARCSAPAAARPARTGSGARDRPRTRPGETASRGLARQAAAAPLRRESTSRLSSCVSSPRCWDPGCRRLESTHCRAKTLPRIGRSLSGAQSEACHSASSAASGGMPGHQAARSDCAWCCKTSGVTAAGATTSPGVGVDVLCDVQPERASTLGLALRCRWGHGAARVRRVVCMRGVPGEHPQAMSSLRDLFAGRSVRGCLGGV